MRPRIYKEIHVFGAVMHRVKSPEERELVAPAMTPVEADFAITMAAAARAHTGVPSTQSK